MSMTAGPGRTYRFFRGEPTFPFGHGLTYTEFALEWSLTPARRQTVDAGTTGLRFHINVTNIGSRPGVRGRVDLSALPAPPLSLSPVLPLPF